VVDEDPLGIVGWQLGPDAGEVGQVVERDKVLAL